MNNGLLFSVDRDLKKIFDLFRQYKKEIWREPGYMQKTQLDKRAK